MKNSSPKKSKKILKFIVFMLLVILLSVLIKINYIKNKEYSYCITLEKKSHTKH